MGNKQLQIAARKRNTDIKGHQVYKGFTDKVSKLSLIPIKNKAEFYAAKKELNDFLQTEILEQAKMRLKLESKKDIRELKHLGNGTHLEQRNIQDWQIEVSKSDLEKREAALAAAMEDVDLAYSSMSFMNKDGSNDHSLGPARMLMEAITDNSQASKTGLWIVDAFINRDFSKDASFNTALEELARQERTDLTERLMKAENGTLEFETKDTKSILWSTVPVINFENLHDENTQLANSKKQNILNELKRYQHNPYTKKLERKLEELLSSTNSKSRDSENDTDNKARNSENYIEAKLLIAKFWQSEREQIEKSKHANPQAANISNPQIANISVLKFIEETEAQSSHLALHNELSKLKNIDKAENQQEWIERRVQRSLCFLR